MGAKQSAQMRHALDLIIKGGMSAYGAARLAGISQGAISKNAEYRKFMETKNAK